MERAMTVIADVVRRLLRRPLPNGQAVPALMEWDSDVPPYPILAGEVTQAEAALASRTGLVVVASLSSS
jgi:hypothetical protein